MKTSKIISTLLTVVILLTSLTVFTSAAASFTPSITGTSSATAGSTVTYTYYVQGENMAAFQGSITYNTSQLEYVADSAKTAFTATGYWMLNANPRTGEIVFTLEDVTQTSTLSGKTALFTVQFKIKSGVAAGTNIAVKATELGGTVKDDSAAGGYADAKMTSTTVSCTTTVAKVKDKNPNLKSLVVKTSAGANVSLSSAFSAGVTTYTANVAYSVSKVTITATAEMSTTKVTISPTPSSTTLTAGKETSFSIKCTAEDGTAKTYTVKIKRAEDPNKKSNDATLKALTVTGATISPKFAKTTYKYTATVPYETSSISVAASANDSAAKVTGTGSKSLQVGSNTISVACTAEDGTKLTYTITVTRKNKAAVTTPPSVTTTAPTVTQPPVTTTVDTTTLPDTGTTTPIETEIPGMTILGEGVSAVLQIGAAPEGATVAATKVSEGAVYESVQNTFGQTAFELFDISVASGGFEILPEGTVKITLPMPEGMSEDTVCVYDADTMDKLDTVVSGDNITFIADSTGEFVIAAEPVAVEATVDSGETKTPVEDTDDITTSPDGDDDKLFSGKNIIIFAVAGILLLAAGAGIMYGVMILIKKKQDNY